MNVQNDLEMITCPMHPNHKVLPSRMCRHLIKCKSNKKAPTCITCPFNVTHVVPSAEFQHHLTVCDSRRDAEIQMASTNELDSTEQFPMCPLPKIAIDEAMASSGDMEGWDVPNVETYNPSEHLIKKNVRTMLRGATKAERRAHREAERRRFTELSVKDEDDQKARDEFGRQKSGIYLPSHSKTLHYLSENADRVYAP